MQIGRYLVLSHACPLRALSIAILLIAFAVVFSAKAQTGDQPSPVRQSELFHLLKHDCGSCHGMTMKGGLGPALTPAALKGKSESFLVQTILKGRPGTPMPPWEAMLSHQEAVWLVKELMNGRVHAR